MASITYIQLYIALAVALLLTACTQASITEPAPMPGLTPPAVIVNITDDSCPSVQIEPGVTLGWRNTGKQIHILQSQTQEDGSRLLDAGTLQPGDGFALTFTDPGTISYICSEDQSLRGTIIVTRPAALPAPVRPQLGSGVAHSCLLAQDGKVFCWGQGAQSSLDVSPQTFGEPHELKGLDAISLAAGWYHTCIVTRDSEVNCWGQNSNGQLGNGQKQDSFLPVDAVDLKGVTAVSAGALHTCALTSSGEVYCWGQNTQGQLGDGTTTDRPTPVQVIGLGGPVHSLAAGLSYTCALMVSGQVDCWGDFDLIHGEAKHQINTSPITLPNLTGGIEKIAAGDYHICVLTKSGEVKCEGTSFPASASPFSKPVEVLGELQGHIRDLLAGTDFTCILKDSGEVYCWGDNYFDQIGDGTFSTAAQPKQVSRAGNEVIALGGGHYTACALAADGKVSCWGDTSFGQTGDGTARWK